MVVLVLLWITCTSSNTSSEVSRNTGIPFCPQVAAARRVIHENHPFTGLASFPQLIERARFTLRFMPGSQHAGPRYSHFLPLCM